MTNLTFEAAGSMSHNILTMLRFITPGIVILIFAALLGAITGLWHVSIPSSLADLKFSLFVIIPAAIYYITPLRDISNRGFADDVTQNIRDQMVAISGLPDVPKLYTWKALRSVFYHFVDEDKSLTLKASQAYFNGYVWTTFADVRTLACIFMLGSLALWIFNGDEALVAAGFFLLLIVISQIGSMVVTRRHKAIGDKQMEIIDLKYRNDLKKMMEAIRDGERGSGGDADARGP